MTYPMTVAGLQRDLPICKVTDDLYIGAFIVFGDAELTVACARELLKLVPAEDYDYMLTAEAKSIPLIHEMARQSGAKKYFIARKGPKAYMPDPIHVEDTSITTAGTQRLYYLMSPLSVTTSYPIDFIRSARQFLHCAASSPVQILSSYNSYFFRTDTGDKFGITTLAPDKIPFSRPFGSMVPRAVVAGRRMFGCISRMIDNR